jgi:hypothetical protein
MLELPLHAGTDHPTLLSVVFSGLIAFVAGIGLGLYRERVGDFLSIIRGGASDLKERV